jgi:hypothetical protein
MKARVARQATVRVDQVVSHVLEDDVGATDGVNDGGETRLGQTDRYLRHHEQC